MKYLLLFLLLAIPVSAHIINESATSGPYAITLTANPEQLEPGQSDLTVTLFKNGQAAPGTQVWVRLSDKKKVYFAGNFVTDNQGSVPVSYYFNGPGMYSLDVEIQQTRLTVPVEVHGNYMLLFGFLAAIFIVLALLLGKI